MVSPAICRSDQGPQRIPRALGTLCFCRCSANSRCQIESSGPAVCIRSKRSTSTRCVPQLSMISRHAAKWTETRSGGRCGRTQRFSRMEGIPACEAQENSDKVLWKPGENVERGDRRRRKRHLTSSQVGEKLTQALVGHVQRWWHRHVDRLHGKVLHQPRQAGTCESCNHATLVGGRRQFT